MAKLKVDGKPRRSDNAFALARTHTQADGQPENIVSPDPSVGRAEDDINDKTTIF